MKKIGEYTATGMVLSSDTEAHRLQLWDGRFDTGYRVTGFEVAFSYRDSSTTYVASAKLMTEPATQNRYWNWGKNSEIAWASCAWDANGISTQTPATVIDPDNMIIEDLYIGAVVYDGEAINVNYIITLDKYDITDWQGALSMVRNKSQG